MKKKSAIPDIFKESITEDMDICVFCGKPHAPRTDKKGRPFIRCHFCGFMGFLNTPLAQLGYRVLARIVKKNLRQHEKLIEEEYRKYVNDKPLIIK